MAFHRRGHPPGFAEYCAPLGWQTPLDATMTKTESWPAGGGTPGDAVGCAIPLTAVETCWRRQRADVERNRTVEISCRGMRRLYCVAAQRVLVLLGACERVLVGGFETRSSSSRNCCWLPADDRGQTGRVGDCAFLGCLQKKFLPQSKHSHRCLSVPTSGYVPVLPHRGHIGAIIEFYGCGDSFELIVVMRRVVQCPS
jgi:hypothetical protein